jgi:tetratricopeptide (TPR) repeat protein
MHDIKELEERWKRYNRKKKMPYVWGGFFIVLATIGGWYVAKNYAVADLKKLLGADTNETKVVASIPAKSSEQVRSSFVFLRSDTLDRLAVTKSRTLANTNREAPLPSVLRDEEMSNTSQKRGGIHIEIVGTKRSGNVYKMIEKRFKMTHDPEDGLFLARYYLKRKDYKRAEYWALQTNKIDSTIEESWLIFAEAKAKAGHRKEAIVVLKEYLKRHDSVKAKALLRKLSR